MEISGKKCLRKKRIQIIKSKKSRERKTRLEIHEKFWKKFKEKENKKINQRHKKKEKKRWGERAG